MVLNKILPYNSKLKPLARRLHQRMTSGEVILWKGIRKRSLGYQFHRQVTILDYIVAFFCHELKLAIEVDGVYHNHPEISVSDSERQSRLEESGVRFLRFEEKEIVNDTRQVVQTIEAWIGLHKS